MGQTEVIEFLKIQKAPMTRMQIAQAMNCDPVKISHILCSLLRWQEIQFIEHNRMKASELVGYVLLRRTKFYFYEE